MLAFNWRISELQKIPFEIYLTMQSIDAINSIKRIQTYLPKCHKSFQACIEYAGFAQGLKLIGMTFFWLAFHPRKFSMFAKQAQWDLFVIFFFTSNTTKLTIFFYS